MKKERLKNKISYSFSFNIIVDGGERSSLVGPHHME